jgi:hypothetical protein
VIGTDCTGSCKSNYHMITATMALNWIELGIALVQVVSSTVFKGLLFLSCHRKFHMNLTSFERSLYLTSFKRSPVLKDHFIFVSKMTS